MLILAGCDLGDNGAREILRNPNFKVVNLDCNCVTDNGIHDIHLDSDLKVLTLDQNNITNANHLTKLRNLKELFLRSNMICCDTSAFLNNTTIYTLDLSQNRIYTRGFITLCQNAHIKTLYLSNNWIEFGEDRFSDQDIVLENKSLVEIDLSGNHIESQEFLKCLMNMEKLTVLNLSMNCSSETGANIFRNHNKFATLNLSGNPISTEYLKLLDLI